MIALLSFVGFTLLVGIISYYAMQFPKQMKALLKGIFWSKFFEEAFNHAYKDFFKKVKDLHPQLITSNDLHLCVYLE